jgi:hypothetical protein
MNVIKDFWFVNFFAHYMPYTRNFVISVEEQTRVYIETYFSQNGLKILWYVSPHAI